MKARRRFGQHFLEPAWVRKVAAAIAPLPGDRLIEIGPGRGALTEPLAAHVARLLAIEVDRDLAEALAARALPNVTVVTADVRKVDLGLLAMRELGARPDAQARVVGNLPYNITSHILFALLETAAATQVFRDATVMVQTEVADRLVATPGTGEYGVLTLTTALGAVATRVLDVPSGAFRPVPQVRSSVVRLTFRSSPVPLRDLDLTVELIRSVFTQRRKTLANALRRFADQRGVDPLQALAKADIDARRRPETLQLVEVARLADVFTPR